MSKLRQQAAQALEQGQAVLAERNARAALRLQPRDTEALRLLALARHQQGASSEAVTLLRQALKSVPNSALLRMNLGSVLAATGQIDAAITELRRACELEPTRAAAWYNLGKNLKAQAHEDAALDALQRAADLRPQHAATQTVLGDVLKALGQTSAAAAALRRALVLDPHSGHAWWSLANLKVVELSHSEIDAMRSALQQPGLPLESQIQIGFALARALDQQGDHAGAFAALVRANDLQAARHRWDPVRFSADVDSLLAAPWQPLPKHRQGHEVIFIVGLPRSGTTLVEQILAAHADVTGASELPDLPAVIAAEDQRRGQRYPHWSPAASDADWQRMGQDYLARTARWQAPGRRFTDKWPNNFFLVDAALRMLPGARVIGCDRAPLDVCWSCYQQLFARDQAFSYKLDDLLAYYRDFRRMDRLWTERFPEHYCSVRYEHLVEQPARYTAELLQFTGLSDDPACTQPHLAKRAIRSASAAQVREPIDQRGIGRWQPYAEQLAPWRAQAETIGS